MYHRFTTGLYRSLSWLSYSAGLWYCWSEVLLSLCRNECLRLFWLMYMKELTQPPNDGTSSDGSMKTITIKTFIRHTRTPSLWRKNHHFIAQRFVHLYGPLSSAYNIYKPMSAIRCHHDYRRTKIALDPKGPRVEVEYYEHLQNHPTTPHPPIGVWKQ